MLEDSREIVLSILLDMDKNDVFSSSALNKALRINQFAEKRDRAFVTRLAEGVTEQRIRLDYEIDRLSKTKVKKMKPLIRSVIRMGAYQVLFMDSIPDNAAINESVKLAKRHGFSSLSGFVNGILRNLAREKNNILANDKLPEYVKYSVPEWLYCFVCDSYGREKAEKIFGVSFSERGTVIRYNRTKTTKEKLKEKLFEAGIEVQDSPVSPDAMIISGYDFIRKVPGFRTGEFSVQDESSMEAVLALDIKEGDSVLDICAAPGGKSLFAAELLGGTGMVVSRDLSSDKTDLIKENSERLFGDDYKFIRIEEKDATVFYEEDVEKYDRIICDVPCSGLGIMGRKNDIKYRMTASQMDELKEFGYSILCNAAKYVKKGGRIVFSTCTINPGENTENVKRFLSEHSEFSLICERQFLQGIDECDGFYYAVLDNLRKI